MSFLFLLSPPFSISLCSFRRSHDIDVVDLYPDLAISLAVTGNVGGLIRYIRIGTTIGELGTGGGVPILGNAIGEVESPNVGVGEVTVLSAIHCQKWHLEPMVLERLSYSLCLLMPARQSLLSR